MKTHHFQVDYGGARGSNTGDAFHELWAVRQALRMLNSSSRLAAIKVEGVPANDGDGSYWDGVDCTLLFGADNLVDAEHVEIQQLKYSAATPTAKWTVARVCRGKNGRPSTSLMRRLGSAFKALISLRDGQGLDSVKVSLVTNQPVSSELLDIMSSARTGVPNTYKRAWTTGDPPLHRLVHASGLSPTDFKRFATVMDFHGNSGSRFALEDQTLGVIADWQEAEFRETSSRLREYIRKRMLPEAAAELITRQTILIQFGVSDERALFPCPSAITAVKNPVLRGVSRKVAAAMSRGTQRICLHGTAGVGKTTALQQVATLLPAGSEMIVFDCYGAGSYLDASKLRHRPRDAFLQLSNELAERLRLPALLEPNSTGDHSRAFRRRLEIAARTLKSVHPKGLLVVAADAADNSIIAATHQGRVETSFVTELISFRELPSNVRVIVSARTGRLDELMIPGEFERLEIPPFSEDETPENVKRYWKASDEWIDEFHHLSGGIPRVQAYAFEQVSEDIDQALETLRPEGKDLDELFEELFRIALTKAGVTELVEKVCAGLAVLPRPIPVVEIAHVLEVPESQIIDTCADLAPGIHNKNNFLTFSDEDFEEYVRQKATTFASDVEERAARRALDNADNDEYAARNVAHLLFLAGRHQKLLDFVESQPEPSTALILDPVQRHEIRDQRLLTAIRVCQRAGDTARALRFVLIGAEAMRTTEATRSLLVAFPRLAVRYAKETSSRLILANSNCVHQHGPLILQSLAHDATRKDRIGFREGWRRFRAWAGAREDNYKSEFEKKGYAVPWTIEPHDVAASMLGTAVLEGADAVIEHFASIRPFRFAVKVAEKFVNRLVVERRFELAEQISEKCRPWQRVFLLVPISLAGRQIDLDRLVSGLEALKNRFRLDPGTLDPIHQDNGIGSYVIDTVLSAVEILVSRGIRTDLISSILSPFLDPDIRRLDARHEFEVPLLDAILRSICLSEVMLGNEISTSDVLTPRPALKEGEEIGSTTGRHGTDHDRRMKELMAVLSPIYYRRSQIIVAAGDRNAKQLDLRVFETGFGADAWRMERGPNRAVFRATIASGLTMFLALGRDAAEVLKCAIRMHGDITIGGRQLCERFTTIPSVHENLVSEILNVVSSTQQERTSAMARSRKLAEFAELLIPISSDDADTVFQKAVVVANELDSEAMDQIRFLQVAIDHGITDIARNDCRSYASAVAEVVNDAAIRLKDVEGFPWHEAMSTIASLDVPTALASAARWDDGGLENIGTTLPPVITVGLSANDLNGAQAGALLYLLDRPSSNLLTSIVKRSVDEGGLAAAGIAEEFAHDSLVDRVAWHDEIEPLIVRYGRGDWTRRYRRHSEFRKTLPDEEKEHPDDRDDRESTGSAIIDCHVWEETTLTSPAKLLSEAEIVLAKSRSVGEFSSLRDVLRSAARAVDVGLRRQHLDTLAGILNQEEGDQILDSLLSSARDWNGQPAVESWCRDILPRLVSDHFPRFTRYLPFEDNRLGPAMTLAQLSGTGAQAAVLKGIERHSDKLDARVLLFLSRIITSEMKPEESSRLCDWYLKRLLDRVAENEREAIPRNDLPVSVTSAVARILYAYLSDVDLRQRWRAAHGLRRLARLGDNETLAETMAQYDRVTECAFRAGNAPFYWLAARLWVVIALDRISEETPDAAAPHGQTLLDICLCDDFPHVLVRTYAADACLKLSASGHWQLGAMQKHTLKHLNAGSIVSGEWTPSGSFDSYSRGDHRFNFDYLDTLRYWYDRWLSVFWNLTPSEFLKAAEGWIVDEWGVVDRSTTSRYQDPRPQHFEKRDWALWSNDHGGHPTLEGYHNYLEWHAMWCAASHFLKTHTVRKEDSEQSDEMTMRISQDKLTYPPMWLSDLLGPVPLQPNRWQPTVEDMDDWLSNIDDRSLLQELFPVDREDWVVVSADIEASSKDREETVKITTSLVSPATAHALVRALQTANSQYDFYLEREQPNLQISQLNYKLGGWLKHPDVDFRFDYKDGYCNGAARPQGVPGSAATRVLDLEERHSVGSLQWFRKGSDSPSFVYESWCGHKQPHDRYLSDERDMVFFGRRTLVKKEDLAEFLGSENRDLIAEIGVTRRDIRESRPSYDTEDEKRAVFDRLVLLRQNGSLEAAERRFEAWCADCT